MRKKIVILSAIFAVLLVIGLWYNLTPGRYFSDRFWRLKDGEYLSWGDSVRYADGEFELSLGGQQLTAKLTEAENGYRMDFSDGWAVEMSAFDSQIYVEVGGVMLTGDAAYILTDMDAANFRFGRVVEEVREPFYDENGNAVGESFYRVTESGESVGWQEIWYDQPEWSSPEAETILLREGERYSDEDFRNNLFVNEDGEYLLNAQDAPMMRWSDSSWRSRSSVAAFLIRIAQEEPGRRGHAAALFLFAFVYLVGAVNFLWPEQVAFFGHRWQFKNEPELSDEGLFMAKLGSIVIMALSVVTLFVGAQ